MNRLCSCVLAGAVGLAGACGGTITEDTRATAIVTGTVTSLSGSLPILSVKATAYAPSCTSSTAVASGIGTTSPPGGSYTLNVISILPPQTACIVVYAIATVNGQRDSVSGGPVSLMLRNDNGPQDTAHINLVFP